jgi:hypothetical protein
VEYPKLERMRELIAAAADARKPDSFARNFDSSLAANPIKRKILADYEQNLLTLDAESWGLLKAEAVKRLIRNKRKGWEPLFDTLNEAKGYAYLISLGCTEVQMIPRSYEYKTPDLRAELNGGVVLCEVKTINMSDDERTIRVAGGASHTSACLSEKFLLGKLTWTLREAKAQLDAFPSPAARKLIYLIFNPDDSLNEYADDYSFQLRAFLKQFPIDGVEVEIFQFPPFYAATS